MATNNFKAFALDPNANIMSQADWEALPALLSGFTAGKASSAQVNKAIRQATTIAALVGQFIANSGVDALDNADVNGLVTKFTNALTTNLRLGTAATKDTGTGPGQIPDMSAFAANLGVSSDINFPNELIVKTGSSTSGAGPDNAVTFPVAFPKACILVIGAYNSASSGNFFSFHSVTRTGFNFRGYANTSITIPVGSGVTCSWIALGY